MKIFIICVLLLLASCAANAAPTIWFSGGETVSNSISDLKSKAWGIKQETPTKYGVWNFGYLNEGHQNGDKRDGIFVQPLFKYNFTDKVETSFAIGPYYTATTVTEWDNVHYKDTYCFSILGTAAVEYQLTNHWGIQGSWNHVLYAKDNKDTDVFLFSLGYTP